MDSRLLAPIPIPPAQRWRQFRLLFLPRVLFALGLAFVIWMWQDAVAPSTVVAEAESIATDMRSTQPGVITSLNVQLHQNVRAGEVLAQVATANPKMLEATLAVINAELGMLRASMTGTTDRQRVVLELERLQLEWMEHRVGRAELQGKLQQLTAELARAEPLHRAKLMTEHDFAQMKINRDTVAAQIAEKNRLISRLEPALEHLSSAEMTKEALSGESALAAAIKVEEAKLKLAEAELAPITLIAPIDGVVAMVRRLGETVVAGDVVVRITSPKPERLAGYLRQPLPLNPKAGMQASIRTRGRPGQRAVTTITFVGTSLETISPTLLPALRLPPNSPIETGLRIEFALPPRLDIRPGEHVDVYIR